MGEMGDGYGSEFHLLRYLGRHRTTIDAAILAKTKGDRITWYDFGFDASTTFGDREIEGMAFLPEGHAIHAAWRERWPSRGTPPNWDAVGVVECGAKRAWLLVEAKANIQELESSCGAGKDASGELRTGSGLSGRNLIQSTLDRTKERLGVDPSKDWLNGYYQYANRLAVLDFLTGQGEEAHLIFIYFTGDQNPGRDCPQSEAKWSDALKRQREHLGLSLDHALANRIHGVFLPAHRGVGRKRRP